MTQSTVDIFYQLVARGDYADATRMINDGFNINSTVRKDWRFVNALQLAIGFADITAVQFILSFNPNINVTRDLILAFDQDNAENGKIIANLLFDACYSRGIGDIERSWENIFDNDKILSHSEIFTAIIDVFTNRTNFDLLTAVRRYIQPSRAMNQGLAKALVNIGFFLPEEDEDKLFKLTFITFGFEAYIILKYRVLTISTAMAVFFIQQNKNFLFQNNREFFGRKEMIYSQQKMLSNQNQVNQMIARTKEYSDRLITANYIRFIPDINLYPPDKQEKVIAFTNSRAHSKFPFLPNELLFKIFSEM